jgi:mycothiol synthase
VSGLPAGLNAAPLSAADAAAVTAVWAASEQYDDGRVEVVEADVVAVFGRPSLDVARDTVGILDGEALVAIGLQLGVRSAFVHVLPAYRGRGIGTWLMRWSQDAARAIGADVTEQEISDNERAAIALLEGDGYTRRWDSWAFEITLEREPPPPALADGYAIRDFVPGRDDRAVHDVIQRAFSEWPEHEPQPFDDWAAMALRRPGFVPSQLGLAVRDDAVVGAVLLMEDEDDEGWVDQLAVVREHRGVGLGKALLMHAFGRTWRRGGRRCGLGTDSRTGVRGLYESVGMHVRKTYGEYAKQL